MRLLPLLLATLLGATLPLGAWGRTGHRTVARLALEDLPPGPAAWFEGQRDLVLDHCSDPDGWKDDPLEGPRHFLDMDAYAGRVPTLLSDARAELGPAVFQHAGQLPWVIQDRVRDLAAAFKRGDRKQVAFLASILSHYVGDLHVPLHTARNFDGQMSGQRGVHSRWESQMVERLAGEPEVRQATLLPDMTPAIWAWLDESHALAPKVLEDDRACDPEPGQRRTKPEGYWLLFTRRQGPVAREQLARAGQRTAQLILYAWVAAGRPVSAP